MRITPHRDHPRAPWRLAALLLLLLTTAAGKTAAQSLIAADSIVAAVDSLYQRLAPDTAAVADRTDSVISAVMADTPRKLPRQRRDWSTWRPSPQRALWLALVIPGGGQIYNRKYWKLPIVYGGFMGCAYAMSWNNNMYRDYAQAYLDIMDDDPGTVSYMKFSHLGRQITPANEERYKRLFKKRKDRYRRYRDMSFFCMIGVYAISVIDAYVDAELSEFDISKDLSLRLEPTIISPALPTGSATGLRQQSVGLQCSFNF